MIIYDTFYSLLETYLFGTIAAGSYVELVAILFSTIGCLFCVAIPFIIVYRLIRLFFGG